MQILVAISTDSGLPQRRRCGMAALSFSKIRVCLWLARMPTVLISLSTCCLDYRLFTVRTQRAVDGRCDHTRGCLAHPRACMVVAQSGTVKYIP